MTIVVIPIMKDILLHMTLYAIWLPSEPLQEFVHSVREYLNVLA